MLGTPPAFILSQDQTLNENGIFTWFLKLKSVWFLLSRQTHLAFANSFWIIVFFKKLSRNFPLIRSLFTYQFADCFKCLSIFRYALSLSVESVLMYKSTLRSVLPRLRAYRKIYFALKFIWLNFYTMKFSRFRFSVCWTFNILTHSVNIVKRFFNFLPSYVSSFQSLLFCDSLIIISNRIRFVKNIFKLLRTFFIPADPLPRGCERKARLLSSDSLTILPLFGLTVNTLFWLFYYV